MTMCVCDDATSINLTIYSWKVSPINLTIYGRKVSPLTSGNLTIYGWKVGPLGEEVAQWEAPMAGGGVQVGSTQTVTTDFRMEHCTLKIEWMGLGGWEL